MIRHAIRHGVDSKIRGIADNLIYKLQNSRKSSSILRQTSKLILKVNSVN